MSLPSTQYQPVQDQTQVNQDLIRVMESTTTLELVKLILQQWRNSETINDMVEADKYYSVRNSEIDLKRRGFTDEWGKFHENDTLANTKIPTAWLRILVDQKVNYALGKPFVIQVEKAKKEKPRLDENGQEIEDKVANEYLDLWNEFVDPHFRKTLKRIGKEAINKGIGWAYVWVDEVSGDLKIMDIFSDTLYPKWTDRAHTKLEAVVRDFTIMEFSGTNIEEVRKVEFWDKNIVVRYDDRHGELQEEQVSDEDAELLLNPAINEDGTQSGWGKVPFISLRASEDELPLLNLIKQEMDAYDYLISKSVDTLIDDIDPVLLFKGISAEVGDLTRARNLLKNTRIASVDADGGADYLQVKADITAIQTKLEDLRRNITRMASGVDFEDNRFGGNPNQLVIRGMYQNMDTYVNELESGFEVFIEDLKYFFDRWLQYKGNGTVEQWAEYRVIVKFNRDMMINESAAIADTVALMGTGISQETIDNFNPAVESYQIEEVRRELQRKKMLEQQQEMNEMFQFQQQQGQDNQGQNEENLTNQ